METEKKGKRGGWRGGVRPTKGRVNVTFRADKDVKEHLDSLSEKSDYINELIRKDFSNK